MTVTRFPGGITTNLPSDPLGDLGIPDPTKWSVYFEDFTGPLFNVASINNTTVTHNGLSIIASANATASVITDAGGLDGCLKIVTTAADNESVLIQTLSPGFVMTAGKKFFMEAKFEVTHTAGTISENEIFIGLSSYQTGANWFATNGSARTFDDGIGWYSPDAEASIELIVGENDVFDTVDAIATYATATWYTCTCYYDGTNIEYSVNGTAGGTFTPDQIPVSVVGPTIYLKTGEAKVHQLLVDYLMIAKERT